MLPQNDFMTGFFRNALFLVFLFCLCAETLSQCLYRKTCDSSSTLEKVFFSPLSIHLMGEAYFACHNELEGINKHQLSGMYYNWKVERLESFCSHTRSVVSLLRISTFTVKGMWPVHMEMNHCWMVNQCGRGENEYTWSLMRKLLTCLLRHRDMEM